MYTSIGLKIFAMINEGVIKSNYQFWKHFGDIEKINNYEIDTKKYEEILKSKTYSLICVFDENFPKYPSVIKNSEKPFFFAYQGDLNLLCYYNDNIAVVGSINPTEDIIQREIKIVKECVVNNFQIVSGLAKGCDEVAHKTCIKNNGKTIAFLPCTIDKIYPTENIYIAKEIVNKGGLIITEYVTKPKNKYEIIQRFIHRDRLQAMYSKVVILIASNRYGEGDSGSRHAMEKAKMYGRKRYVMFNNNIDKDNPIFALNQDLLKDDVIILSPNSIREMRIR